MHIPVLLKEVIEYLDPQPNENFVDCTLGEAGHAIAMLERNGPKGKVLGIDQDPKVIENTKDTLLRQGFGGQAKYEDRLILVCDNFVNLKRIFEKTKFRPVSGILMDLGISSWHLEESEKGFSFSKNEPLDMRIGDSGNGLTAKEIINSWPQEKLQEIIEDYSQERFAKSIAKAICQARKIKPIETTFELAQIIKKTVPQDYERKRINPATRTFLALRIAVNNELKILEKTLPQAIEALEKKGRIVIISFHSLEDKIVKSFLKTKEKEEIIGLLTKKPIIPCQEELRNNPRSRSAKLRAALKL